MSVMERARVALVQRPILVMLLLGLPIFLGNYFGGRPGINGWDANFYFSYAAAFSSGELDLEAPYAELVSRGADPTVFDVTKRTATGHVYNFYPTGHPLLHTPALMFGRLVGRITEGTSSPFSATAQLLYSLSCIFAAAAGLELIRRNVARLCGDEGAAFALYAMVACSPLGYYWFILPAQSHTTSLLFVGLTLEFFARLVARRESDPVMYAALGIALGGAVLVRLQDVALAPFGLVAAWLAVRNPLPLRGRIARLAALIAGGLFVVAIQLLHWKWKDGAWIVTEYSDYAGFDWVHPQFTKLWFSARHGLFTWHPMLLVAVAGFVHFVRTRSGELHQRPLVGAMGGSFLLLSYIGASFSIWWFGDSFGSRPFLSMTPLFVLGFAELWRCTRGAWIVYAIGGVAAAWNALLMVSFHFGWISRSEALDVGALIAKLFR
jgi:hypothetical protein